MSLKKKKKEYALFSLIIQGQFWEALTAILFCTSTIIPVPHKAYYIPLMICRYLHFWPEENN